MLSAALATRHTERQITATQRVAHYHPAFGKAVTFWYPELYSNPASVPATASHPPPNCLRTMDFRIQLDVFRGPLDLLLYLVRKHEVEITEVSLSAVAQQYLEYLDLLRELDLNLVGEFVEMASILAEIKSRLILPRGGEEEAPIDDTPHDLVRQLLEYKRYRDAASMLEERGQAWQDHFARLANDAPPAIDDPAGEPIAGVEPWDLLQAFHEVLRQNQAPQGPSIVYDDTPIHVYMAQIQQRLAARGRVKFSQLFSQGMHKSQLVGIFLAILELMRHQMVVAQQDQLFGELWVLATDTTAAQIDPTDVDNYEHSQRNDAPNGAN